MFGQLKELPRMRRLSHDDAEHVLLRRDLCGSVPRRTRLPNGHESALSLKNVLHRRETIRLARKDVRRRKQRVCERKMREDVPTVQLNELRIRRGRMRTQMHRRHRVGTPDV